MPEIEEQRQPVQFGVFEVDKQTRSLRKHGIRLKLQEQPFQILLLLIAHPGDTVTREDIQKRLWPDNTYVDFDNAINSAVRKLRDALGDSPDNSRFIETLPRIGYRFIAPISGAFEKASNGRPAASVEVQSRSSTAAAVRHPRIVPIVVATIVILAVSITPLLYRRTSKSLPTEFHSAPLTANTGLELQPSFSPDETRVAYAWTIPPQQSAIYVKLNGPGDPVKLTKDLKRVFSPAWSPDGRWIAALQDLGSIGVILLIPASGGSHRQVARVVKAGPNDDACVTTAYPLVCGVPYFGSMLAWSPDGKYLFTSAQTAPGVPPGIVRVSVDTGEVQALTAPPRGSAGDFGPAISPDGMQLAFGRFKSIRTGDLYLIPLSAEKSLTIRTPRQITTDNTDVRTAAWTADGRELIFSSDRGGNRQLWRVLTAQVNSIRPVGIGEDALDVAVSQSGKTLIYNRGHFVGSLWKIPTARGESGAPVRITATTARDKFSQISPDGKRIAFQSARSGVDEIWVCDSDGANATQLTTFRKGLTGTPRWSPDGQMIAFDGNAGGSFDIYTIHSDGGRPLRLTNNPETDAIPTWSRDGTWVYFSSSRTGRSEVWKVRASGGAETQLTTTGGALGTESADGKDLYFVHGDEDGGDLYRMPVSGGAGTKVLSSVKGRLFTIFPRGLYFVAGSDRPELQYLEFATGHVRPIAPMPSACCLQADVSPDERWAIATKPEISDTNLIVVDRFH